MAKIRLLIDTDIFIDYFNHGFFEEILENEEFDIYYSAVTKKELPIKARTEKLGKTGNPLYIKGT